MRGFTELKTVLESDWSDDSFSVLGEISRHIQRDIFVGRELVIRALDGRDTLDHMHQGILSELTVAVGLYPYVNELEPLTIRSALQHCSHRVDGGEESSSVMGDIVLHASQAKVLRYLVAGESIILSAPTSFGKSLLIDALISLRNYEKVVLIVPTLALVEETRRRMSKFANRYQIITSGDGIAEGQAIYVLTQERYLSMDITLSSHDFFAIDEFYKLSLQSGEGGERATQLNQAFLRLLQFNCQFYMLGPSIGSIPAIAEQQLDCRFIVENFQTVASELHLIPKEPSRDAAFLNLMDEISGQTMIYCQSPKSARTLMKHYLENREITDSDVPELVAAASWTAENYHPDWLISKALAKGIGIHHGKLPRALGRFMVKAFEEQKINLLLCTSTLIEGVNTTAKNIIIYDHKLNNRKLEFFTFNNIRGRTGRMFQHFVGHVYVFESPPEQELPYVDMAAIEPTGETPSSILLQFEIDDVPESLRPKYDDLTDGQYLSKEVLLSNSGVEPEFLLATAEHIRNLSPQQLVSLQWSSRPDYADIGFTSELIWEYLGGKASAKYSGLLTHKMMTYWVWELYKQRSVSGFIKTMLRNRLEKGVDPDVAVEDILAFLRGWASFNYPKYLTALNDVADEVLRSLGLNAGNFSHFSTDIEHLFQPASFSALEEYGLPAEISGKLLRANLFRDTDELSDVVKILKSIDVKAYSDSPFEVAVLKDFQSGL
jgi:hypothetical protein